MVQAAAGSSDAFSEIVERHHAKVVAWFRYLVRDGETARDLAQECFLKILRNARGYTPRSKFTTFLYTVVRRLALDERRRVARAGEPLTGQYPSHAPGPDTLLENSERKRMLAEAIARLPEEEREVFLLSEVSGLGYREIARAVGCPEGTVASRKNRAARKLREDLRRRWR